MQEATTWVESDTTTSSNTAAEPEAAVSAEQGIALAHNSLIEHAIQDCAAAYTLLTRQAGIAAIPIAYA